jgi:general secretion pathway protein A
MYEQYYGFVQSPFTLTPDPRFLYRSESHEEAITLLQQAIRRKEGFIVLTGDIGTGKTTTCRALLEQLDANVFTSLVLNRFYRWRNCCVRSCSISAWCHARAFAAGGFPPPANTS